MKNFEILSPVANMEMARAAVQGGCSAVYVGAPGFNARGRVETLSPFDLKEIIDYCHLHGVQVFLALNVLIFEPELKELGAYLQSLLDLGPDAFIIQDVGLVSILQKMAPEARVHASTQMTVSSPEAIDLLSDLNMKRYVLSREMSLEEIQKVRESTEAELEVFVHGALCVSYSGQCLTSESFGGRSANRGQCAQSCRLEYEFWVDGEFKEMQGKEYLFSPKDLCGISEVPKLREMGVESYKIEGRLKEPEYVANTAKAYSSVLENPDASEEDFSNWKNQLGESYSRGFFSGWLNGVDHQELVGAKTKSHLGRLVGKVFKASKNSICVDSNTTIVKGDGVLLVGPKGEQKGARVWNAQDMGSGEYQLDFENKFEVGKVKGWDVWRNDSPSADKEIKRIWTDKTLARKIPVQFKVEGALNQKLCISAKDALGNKAYFESENPLEIASGRALSSASLEKELGGLSSTVYKLQSLKNECAEGLFFGNKELRRMKRELCFQLDEAKLYRAKIEMKSTEMEVLHGKRPLGEDNELEIDVLVRQEEQIEALEGLHITSITMDFEWGKDYKPGLKRIREMGFKAGIATLRIHKPGENHHLRLIEALKPDRVLVRSLGALGRLHDSGLNLVGDHGLNICNTYTADYFKNKNLDLLSACYDLNSDQLKDLYRNYGGQNFEMVIHHYMPAFHMEHCLYAAFLSKGHTEKDCGKPCERHKVEVKDPKGVFHYLKPDQECRNTMYHGVPQSADRLIREAHSLGVSHFRIESLWETCDELRTKVIAYYDYIKGDFNSWELHDRLGEVEKYGLGEGRLFKVDHWEDRKK